MTDTLWILLKAVPMTLTLSVMAVVPGAAIAAFLTFLRLSKRRPARRFANVYVYLFRATPLLLLLYFVYYGLPQFAFIRHGFLWTVFRSSMWCAGIALSINASAYAAEVFRAAISSVPRGAVLAAQAAGMTRLTIVRRVTLPLAVRQGLPAYSNEVIEMVKATSLVSTITIVEVTEKASLLVSTSFQTFRIYLMAAVVYLLVTGVLTGTFYAFDWWLQIDRRMKSIGVGIASETELESSIIESALR